MPWLLKKESLYLMGFSGLMKARIMYGEQYPFLLDNYFDLSDLIAYSDAEREKVKFIFTADNTGKITRKGRSALELINSDQEIVGGAVILGDRYDSLQGIEVSASELGRLEKNLAKKQILNSKCWRIFARNPDEVPKEFAEDVQLLPEYVDFMALKREAKGLPAFPMMKVCINNFDKAKLRAWCAYRLVGRAFADGVDDLVNDVGRLIELAPEAQAKLNRWKPL
jgi:hypothetical protein